MTDKVSNIKKRWKDPRATVELSECGLQNANENEESINSTMEHKCPFHWQLKKLQRSRPNTMIILNMQSSRRVPESTTVFKIEYDEVKPILEQGSDKSVSWDLSPLPNS